MKKKQFFYQFRPAEHAVNIMGMTDIQIADYFKNMLIALSKGQNGLSAAADEMMKETEEFIAEKSKAGKEGARKRWKKNGEKSSGDNKTATGENTHIATDNTDMATSDNAMAENSTPMANDSQTYRHTCLDVSSKPKDEVERFISPNPKPKGEASRPRVELPPFSGSLAKMPDFRGSIKNTESVKEHVWNHPNPVDVALCWIGEAGNKKSQNTLHNTYYKKLGDQRFREVFSSLLSEIDNGRRIKNRAASLFSDLEKSLCFIDPDRAKKRKERTPPNNSG